MTAPAFYAGQSVALSDQLATTTEKRVWVQIAKTGTFLGHAAGPFELNAKVFAEIIRNFRQAGQPIPWDFEHASEQDPTKGSIPTIGTPAQGWIHDLKIEGGNLLALVEWGDLARQYIRSGQYRYCSPAIRFGAKDRVTGQDIGARLSSVALTNEPFLDHMQPLAAKDAAPPADETLEARLMQERGIPLTAARVEADAIRRDEQRCGTPEVRR